MCCTDNSQARGLPGTSDQSPCWKSFGVIFTAKGCTADQRATWKTGNCYRSAGLGAWNTECPLPLASFGGVCPAVSFWAGSKQHLGHIDGVPSLNISLGFTSPIIVWHATYDDELVHWRIHHLLLFLSCPARILRRWRALARLHQRAGILQWPLRPKHHVSWLLFWVNLFLLNWFSWWDALDVYIFDPNCHVLGVCI